MHRGLVLFIALIAVLAPDRVVLAQAHPAPGVRIVSSISWVEEWDTASGQWVRVGGDGQALSDATAASMNAFAEPVVSVGRAGAAIMTETVREAQSVRLAAPGAQREFAAAQIQSFGPFRVIDGRRAALVGPTDARSPQAFAAMIAQFPGLEVIEFLDGPGTTHDLANLRLGRAIRAAGLATHVPAGGSARSGAVELFLAGTRRTVDAGALFAVHSWRDERGREPSDFAPEAPENRLYLDYYAEMGMSADQARAFYAMTNSVPHSGALWLDGAEMARWIAPTTRAIDANIQSALQLAVARSGNALASAFSARWSLPQFSIAKPAALTEPAPRLAYAAIGVQGGAGLLDSWAAFP